MSPSYGALRLWAMMLIIVRVMGVVFVVIGTIFAVTQAVTFAQALAIALGQGLRAIADVAEYVQEQQSKVR
jgi:hypothetical protein